MIVTTTNAVEGQRIVAYHGIVSGEAIFGANVFRDFLRLHPRRDRRALGIVREDHEGGP
jgi:uncharacterized protein YbjQ (UPF0145 family)